METQRPNWLAGQDFTTFANERRPSGNQVSPDPPQRAARTGRADALVFLAAVWLVIASVSVAYQSTGRFDVLWNDAVVGIAVGVVTVTRLAGAAMPRPRRSTALWAHGWWSRRSCSATAGVVPADFPFGTTSRSVSSSSR